MSKPKPSAPTPGTEPPQTLRRLMAGQRFGVLATEGQGQPYANLVAFATGDDLRRIFLATPRDSAKHRNMTANPRVALLVDDRPKRGEGVAEAGAATIIGAVAEVPEAQRAAARRLYLARHPELNVFLDSPDTVLLQLVVETCVVVNGLDQVSTWPAQG